MVILLSILSLMSLGIFVGTLVLYARRVSHIQYKAFTSQALRKIQKFTDSIVLFAELLSDIEKDMQDLLSKDARRAHELRDVKDTLSKLGHQVDHLLSKMDTFIAIISTFSALYASLEVNSTREKDYEDKD